MRPALFALAAVAGMSCVFHITAGESTVGFRSHPLTIDEAVQLALKQNPPVLQQIQQLKAEKGLVYQAQARLLPQLTAASNYSQTDTALNPTNQSRATNFDLIAVPKNNPTLANAFPIPATTVANGSAN